MARPWKLTGEASVSDSDERHSLRQAGRSCRPMPVEMNSDSDDGKHKYFTGKFKLVRLGLGVLVRLLELGARRRRTGMSKNGANLNEEPFNSVLFKLYSASLCN